MAKSINFTLELLSNGLGGESQPFEFAIKKKVLYIGSE